MFRYFVIMLIIFFIYYFFFNDTATTEIYTLSLHDALPICFGQRCGSERRDDHGEGNGRSRLDPRLHETSLMRRSEEHTSELQSRLHLVCRLLLEKKKTNSTQRTKCSSTTR